MPFTGNCLTLSFKRELLQGLHNFGPGGHTFRLALYTPAATLNENTQTYISTNEIPTTGSYTAGGIMLAPIGPQLIDGRAVVTFNNVTVIGGNFTTRGGLIYNTNGNRSVAVLDFGSNKVSSGGVFNINFSPITSTLAVIQIR